MIDEQLEFEIAQFADRTLAADRAETLRAQIAGDEEASALLTSYEKMNSSFRTLPTLPLIDWTRLTSQISAHLDRAEPVVVDSYPMPWLKRAAGFAVAACLLIAAGVAFRMHTPVAKNVNPETARGQIAVAGPAIEPPAGQVIQQIAIGPSAVAAADGENLQYGDAGVIVRPSRVVIASAVDAAQDSQQDSNSTPY